MDMDEGYLSPQGESYRIEESVSRLEATAVQNGVVILLQALPGESMWASWLEVSWHGHFSTFTQARGIPRDSIQCRCAT